MTHDLFLARNGVSPSQVPASRLSRSTDECSWARDPARVVVEIRKDTEVVLDFELVKQTSRCLSMVFGNSCIHGRIVRPQIVLDPGSPVETADFRADMRSINR